VILRLKPFFTAALVALGVASTPVLSQDGGWIFGAGGGQARAKTGCPEAFIPGFTCDDSGSAWRVFGGYQFNPYIGYEVGYADFRKVTEQSSAGVTATFDANAIDIVFVGTIPFSQQFSLFGKIGVFRWDLDVTVTGTASGTNNAKGKNMTYGFGAKYNFTRNFALRLERQRYLDVGEESVTGKSDINVDLLSVVFQF
jgi:OOP family OmpA-OmpF porin